jgi:hypothetical protein
VSFWEGTTCTRFSSGASNGKSQHERERVDEDGRLIDPASRRPLPG